MDKYDERVDSRQSHKKNQSTALRKLTAIAIEIFYNYVTKVSKVSGAIINAISSHHVNLFAIT